MAENVRIILGGTGIGDSNPLPVVLTAGTEANVSVQTAATGTNWTAFSSQAANELYIINDTGTSIEVRQGGAGVALPILNNTSYTFGGITNLNQLEVRRVDTSNSQVTVKGRYKIY